MNFSTFIQIIFGVFGGLGIFLIGMKYMSDGMQAVAGERLRMMIGKVTDNRIIACGTGAGITALIQSSSVTTVMVVGMVNAGLMSLKQSIGVILGADIGTTITAWIISLNIADYGLPILGFSAFFYLFAKRDSFRYTAMMIVGLGMIFFGLEIMKQSLMPIRNSAEVLELFSRFKPDSYWGVIRCVFIGAMVTAVVQSSSATVAITITLARTGAIGYDTAVALVLGQNIGTTITAFLASLGTSRNAKRAAMAHILIKIIGVAIMVPLYFRYVVFLKWLIPESVAIATRIAVSHTVFNVIIVILFIPCIALLTKFVCFIIPDKKKDEQTHLTYFDVGMCETPTLAIQQSFQAINKMADVVKDMMEIVRESLENPSENKKRDSKLFYKERQLDLMQKEIVEFISKMLTGIVSQDVSHEARKQLRMADEYESIGDYIEKILKLQCRLRNDGLAITKIGLKDLFGLHDTVLEYLDKIQTAVQNKNSGILMSSLSYGNSITHDVKDVRSKHLSRLEKKEASPLQSLNYMDMLGSYRRIKDHALNIAEVLAGEK